MKWTDRSDIVECLTRLLEHHFEIFGCLHHPECLLTRPSTIHIVEHDLSGQSDRLNIANSRHVALDIAADFYGMRYIASVSIALDNLARLFDSLGANR